MSALLRDSAIYLLARGVPAAISFAALAVYTRILSPEEFGLYALAMTAVTLGNALLFRWLNAGVKRYVFRYRKERGPFLATVATAFGAAVLVATAIAACAAGRMAPVLSPGWVFLANSLVCRATRNT